MDNFIGAQISVFGIVQGVGFRPFIYNLAKENSLTGWVRNTSANVEILVEGPSTAISQFVIGINSKAPSLAHITRIDFVETKPTGLDHFEILKSEPILDAFQPISPDIGICPDCLRELYDQTDRRYRYPFINCTNCGPRYTIIKDIPYDRPKTTMADFKMCEECYAEYQDPTNRRFHAQPVACPKCGPQIWLEWSESFRPNSGIATNIYGDNAIRTAQDMLRDGYILAIKGIGGFHLACDAKNQKAVRKLRDKKLRIDKPFAIMIRDLEEVSLNCFLNEISINLLESHAKPIVILTRREESTIAKDIAPGQNTIGVMLPYTPLHHLLLTPTFEHQEIPNSLVMTSGNLSEEPIVTTNEKARDQLSGLADAFIFNDRPIHIRCDDSVLQIIPALPESYAMVRRSRGYSPFPIFLGREAPSMLGTGAELKNTFCLTKGNLAFLSHHIGDLENYETYQALEDGIAHFEKLFRVKPEVIAYDLHPNYLSTRYAIDRQNQEGLPALAIQHHHAHIAACMADNSLPGDQPVIGVAFDGTGYGDDGAIWGGEFLIADYSSYSRMAHLRYLPLPGGDATIRRPSKIALSYLWSAGIDWAESLQSTQDLNLDEKSALKTQLSHNFNTALTSSMGRLFDAISAVCGVRQRITYEAQAAIELEAICDPSESGYYTFDWHQSQADQNKSIRIIDPIPVIKAVSEDVAAGVQVGRISAKFHNGIANCVLQITKALSQENGINRVILSGGVWQNLTLLQTTYNLLLSEKFEVYIHRQLPTNDGGISIGQVVIAINRVTGNR